MKTIERFTDAPEPFVGYIRASDHNTPERMQAVAETTRRIRSEYGISDDPRTNRREVVCRRTHERWESAMDAAESLGTHSQTIYRAIKARSPYRGRLLSWGRRSR